MNHIATRTTPKLSVALPVYNTKEEHLRECIESILSQSFTDFECIIYNDASTTPYIASCVQSYDDSRIIYCEQPYNMGISATRNAILERARGEYIAIVDHDDICMPHRFEKQVQFLDKTPEIGIVSSWVQTFPKTAMLKGYEWDDDIRALLFRSCSILHPASMIRRELFVEHNLRYESDFSPAEDYMLWCRCMKYTKFHILQEVLLLYRVHEQNTSTVQKHAMSYADKRIKGIMRHEYPQWYMLSLIKQKMEQYQTKHVRLFGFLPFLKRKRIGEYIYWYLFHYLPILRYRVK